MKKDSIKAVSCDCDVIHADIVNEVREKMPPAGDFSELAELFKTFSDETRLKILWALKCSEMCVCDLAVLLNMSKSAISHQLRNLRVANLVKTNKQGKVVYYSLADSHVKGIFEMGFDHIHEDLG